MISFLPIKPQNFWTQHYRTGSHFLLQLLIEIFFNAINISLGKLEVKTWLCLGFHVMFPAVLSECTKTGRWRQISINIFKTMFYARTQQKTISCMLTLELPPPKQCSLFRKSYVLIFLASTVPSGDGGRVFSVPEVSATGYVNSFARQSAAATTVQLTRY